MFYYRERLLNVVIGFPREEHSRSLVIVLACAFLPAAVIGLAIHAYITEYLFSPITVGSALIVGGFAILIIERTRTQFRIHDVSELCVRDSVLIGFAQCLALFPGMSRSGSTIMGGLLIGLDRKTATEFSFLLALPTMLAATGYQLVKSRELFLEEHLIHLGIGMVVTFVDRTRCHVRISHIRHHAYLRPIRVLPYCVRNYRSLSVLVSVTKRYYPTRASTLLLHPTIGIIPRDSSPQIAKQNHADS